MFLGFEPGRLSPANCEVDLWWCMRVPDVPRVGGHKVYILPPAVGQHVLPV